MTQSRRGSSQRGRGRHGPPSVTSGTAKSTTSPIDQNARSGQFKGSVISHRRKVASKRAHKPVSQDRMLSQSKKSSRQTTSNSGTLTSTQDESREVQVGLTENVAETNEHDDMRSLFGDTVPRDEVFMAIDVRERSTMGCAYYVSKEDKLYLMQDCKLGDAAIIETCQYVHFLFDRLLTDRQ